MLRKLVMPVLLVCALAWTMPAQDQPNVPKLLILEREEIKPGKVTAHRQEAHRFLQIAEKHQAAVYRVGGMAIAGNTNEIFYLSFVNSYAEYERNSDFPPAMVAELASFEAQSGDLHQSQRSIIAEFVPELSYRPEAHSAALNNAKRITLTIVRTRPGTRRDLEDAEKTFIEAHKKAGITNEYWLAYNVQAGMPAGALIYVEASPSLASRDRSHSQQIREIVGEENLKKARAVFKDSVLFEETVIVGVDPMVSRPTKEMLAANPSWWTVKAPSVAAGPSAAEKTLTLEGTLVDSKCYLKDNSLTGNDHGGIKECGTMCLRGGSPGALLTKDKKLHAILAPSTALAPYVGQTIRVRGMVHNGAIAAEKVEVNKAGTWEEVKLGVMM